MPVFDARGPLPRGHDLENLLRRIGKDATEITDLTSLDNYVRDCKDELIGEYQKAQAEWGTNHFSNGNS